MLVLVEEEALLADLGMSRQCPIGETPPIRLVYYIDHSAWGLELEGTDAYPQDHDGIDHDSRVGCRDVKTGRTMYLPGEQLIARGLPVNTAR
jgi:hypothetical protein